MFDSTPIENLFLLEYLPAAPDAFLRVYLYARMLALHPELGGDLSQMARALRLDEDAVYEAFAYWEQQGLARRVSDHPPTFELIPMRSADYAAVNPMERDYYAYRDFNASLQALFGAKAIESHEYRIANDWLNVLGYEQDAALKLAEYGIRTSRVKDPNPRSVFKRMDKLAVQWADRGLRSLEDVERAIAEAEGVYPVAQAVLKEFGLSRKPSRPELECVKRWTGEWGFSREEVLAACAETTKASKPTFAYLDAVLKNRRGGADGHWRELADILKELDAARAQPTPDQLAAYAELLDKGFEPGTVRLAAIQCHRRNRNRFEDAARMLEKWGEQGIFTATAAEAYIRDLQVKDRRLRAILELCGLERRPTMDDLALYEEWRETHDDAVIDCAAACARGMQLPMKFMNKLLADWQAAGVRTVAEAEARRDATRANRPAGGQGAANPALDYAQREYKEEDYGDDFFFDVVKEYGDGGKNA